MQTNTLHQKKSTGDLISTEGSKKRLLVQFPSFGPLDLRASLITLYFSGYLRLIRIPVSPHEQSGTDKWQTETRRHRAHQPLRLGEGDLNRFFTHCKALQPRHGHA